MAKWWWQEVDVMKGKHESKWRRKKEKNQRYRDKKHWGYKTKRRKKKLWPQNSETEFV
jgi:hypothetical protein